MNLSYEAIPDKEENEVDHEQYQNQRNNRIVVYSSNKYTNIA